jgi:hypothetical protein
MALLMRPRNRNRTIRSKRQSDAAAGWCGRHQRLRTIAITVSLVLGTTMIPILANPGVAAAGTSSQEVAVCNRTLFRVHMVNCKARLAEAERRWPGSQVVLTRKPLSPGQYLVPEDGIDFAHVTINEVVRPRRAATVYGTPSTTRQTLSTTATSLCWGCKYNVEYEVTVQSFLWGNSYLDTHTNVVYGYWAQVYSYRGWHSGAGTFITNEWWVSTTGKASSVTISDVQQISYWGCCTGDAYMGVVVNDHAQLTKWWAYY